MSTECITLSSDDEPEIEAICHISKGVVVKRDITKPVHVKEEDEDITIISESLTKSTPARINKVSSSIAKIPNYSGTNEANSLITKLNVNYSITITANSSTTNNADSKITNNAKSSVTNKTNSSVTNKSDSSVTKMTNSSVTTKADSSLINEADSSAKKLTISEFSSLVDNSKNSLENNLSKVTVVKVDSTTITPNDSDSTVEKKELLSLLLLQPSPGKSKGLNEVVKNNSLEINEIETIQKPKKHIAPTKVSEPLVSNETSLPKKANLNKVSNSEAGPSRVEKENLSVVRRTEDLEIRGLFINLLELYKKKEKADLMEVAERKLWRYYRDTSTDYLKCETFKNILKTEIAKMKSVDEDHDACISMKKVLEELKSKPQIKTRKLKRLNLTLSKVLKKIKQLECTEVTSDEEEDDAYIKLDRYRKRAVKIYTKICEINDKPSDADRVYLRKISFSGCPTYPCIDHALERYYNKKRKFPDFVEVKKLITMVVQEEKLNLPPDEIQSIAQKLFTKFGSDLQRRRMYDDYQIMVEYLDEDECDPATKDKELLEKLNANKKLYHNREQEVIDEFVKKELELKMKKQEENEKLSKTSEDSDDTTSSHESDSSTTKKRKRKTKASTPSRPDFLSSDSEAEEFITPCKKIPSSTDKNSVKRIKRDNSDSEDTGKESANNDEIAMELNTSETERVKPTAEIVKSEKEAVKSETEVKTDTNYSSYKTSGYSIQSVPKLKQIEVTTVINLDDSDSERDPDVTLDLEVHASESDSCSDGDGVVQLTPQIEKSPSVLITRKPSENLDRSKTDARNTTFVVNGSRSVVVGDQTALVINPKETKVFKRFTSESTTNPCVVTLD